MKSKIQNTSKNNIRQLPAEATGAVAPGAVNPITEGIIWKQVLLFFFPLLLSSFFQQLYNTADAMIVGQAAGKEALTAVAGSAGSLLSIFLFFYIGFAGGAAVLTAQYFGAKKYSALRDTVRLSLLLSTAVGFLGFLICFFLAGPILRAMGAPAETMTASFRYLRIIAPGMVANALYNMGAALLRATGDVRRPLFILIGTCLANIALDLLFVAHLHLGAPGAAIATFLCQLLSAAAVLLCLLRTPEIVGNKTEAAEGRKDSVESKREVSGRKKESVESKREAAGSKLNISGPREKTVVSKPEISGSREKIAESKREAAGRKKESVESKREAAGSRGEAKVLCRRILRLGLPLGMAEVMYTFANLILMAVVNSFGTDTVAAYGAYTRIDAIFWMIVGSFGIAITTFVGQNVGAGKWNRVFQCIRDCAAMMFLVLGLVIAALYFGSPVLMGLFSADKTVVRIGVDMMHFLMPFYFLYIPIEILFSALRGMGDSLMPTILTFFGVCLLRSAWGIFVVPLHHTPNMVLAGFPVTWTVTSIAFIIYFRWYVRHRIRTS